LEEPLHKKGRPRRGFSAGGPNEIKESYVCLFIQGLFSSPRNVIEAAAIEIFERHNRKQSRSEKSKVNMVWEGYRSRLHKCNDFNAHELFNRDSRCSKRRLLGFYTHVGEFSKVLIEGGHWRVFGRSGCRDQAVHEMNLRFSIAV
jgi:hypothetical protein